MTYTFTRKKERLYRYYTCTRAISEGYDQCPSPSLPAAEIERVVIEQIKAATRNPILKDEVLRQVHQLVDGGRGELVTQERQTVSEIRRCEGEIQKLSVGPTKPCAEQLASLHERVRVGTERLRDVREKLAETNDEGVDDREIGDLFDDFDAVWGTLAPKEQADVVRLLVAKVEFDGTENEVSVSFHDTGSKAQSPGKARK